jgi:hypothetical protein
LEWKRTVYDEYISCPQKWQTKWMSTKNAAKKKIIDWPGIEPGIPAYINQMF